MNNQSGKIPNQSKSPEGTAPPNAELSDPAPAGSTPSHCPFPGAAPSSISLLSSSTEPLWDQHSP